MKLLEAHSQTVYTSRIYMPYCLHRLNYPSSAASKAYCVVQKACFCSIDPGPPHFWSSANIVLRQPIFESEIAALGAKHSKAKWCKIPMLAKEQTWAGAGSIIAETQFLAINLKFRARTDPLV